MPIGLSAQSNVLQNNQRKHQKYKLVDLDTFGGPKTIFQARRSQTSQIPGTTMHDGSASRVEPPSYTSKRAQVVSHLDLPKVCRAAFGCCVVEVVFD